GALPIWGRRALAGLCAATSGGDWSPRAARRGAAHVRRHGCGTLPRRARGDRFGGESREARPAPCNSPAPLLLASLRACEGEPLGAWLNAMKGASLGGSLWLPTLGATKGGPTHVVRRIGPQ